MPLMSGQSAQGLVDVEIRPLPIIIAADLDSLGMDIRSYHEPLKRSIQQVIIPSIDRNFQAEGRPSPWEPLSDAALALRAYYGYPDGPILQRSGNLRRAAGALARWTIGTENAYAGGDWPTNVWYGPMQHTGQATIGATTGLKFETLPSRPFMLIQEEDQGQIQEVFANWFMERAAAHGFS